MQQKEILRLAEYLHQARLSARSVPQLSSNVKNFLRPDAYSIQEAGINLRREQGEKIVGYKMGLTSEAKRRQMKLPSPLYGVVTDQMQVSGVFHLKGSIHPKIEPEIAFLIQGELSAKPTRDEVLSATKSVCACLEILDSRYEHFKYFSMEDVIADNSSSSHFVLGVWKTNFNELDLRNLKMQLNVNGLLAEVGNSSDISGDPVVSVIELCELLAERGQKVPPNSVVLAGAATSAVQLKSGDKFELLVQGFDGLRVEVVD